MSSVDPLKTTGGEVGLKGSTEISGKGRANGSSLVGDPTLAIPGMDFGIDLHLRDIYQGREKQ